MAFFETMVVLKMIFGMGHKGKSMATLNLRFFHLAGRLALQAVAIFLVSGTCLASNPAKEQVDRLISAARLYDEPEMNAAIEAIVDIGSPAIPELRPGLKDFDDNVRWQIIIAMGRIGEEARGEVPRIILALGDNDSDVRAAAAEALGMLGVDHRAVTGQLEKCLSDRHGIVRASANWALWEFREHPRYISGLTNELDSADWIVTDRAVRHLADIGRPADPYLAQYLQHGGNAGRQHAAKALIRKVGYSPTLIPVLAECLEDGDPKVAKAAAEALGHAGKVAVPSLVEALGKASSRVYASYALGKSGKVASPALPILVRQLSEPGLLVRLSTVQAIGQIGVNRHNAEGRLSALLKDRNQDVRGAVCQALANLEGTSGQTLEALQALAKEDPKDFVRQAANDALAKIRARASALE